MPITMNQSSFEIPETRAEKALKKMALYFTSLFFIITGLRHFIMPEYYLFLMPKYLPLPLFLINFTGFLQIFCAIGLLFSRTRKWASYGLMIFLIATLPVLIYLWTYKESSPNGHVPGWLQLFSVPLQFVLIFWVYLFSQKPKSY